MHTNPSGSSMSIWMETKMPSFPSLNQNLNTDVCIVGGGIAGLTCAYLLAKKGLSIVLLERQLIGGDQSSRTSGHLSWILDDRYSDLEQIFGLEGSKLAADSHRSAVDLIEKIVKEEQIECDFERLDAYLFVPPEDSKDILDKEMAAAQRAGIRGEKVARAPFSSFDTGPCLHFPHQAQFHILKYLRGLAAAIKKMGGQLYESTPVVECRDGAPCSIKTERGQTVEAQHLIIATNSPINDRFMMHSKQAAYRTYVIAARIPKDSVSKGLYWDTPDPYHYIRIQKDENNPMHDWLIIGGEDRKTGQDDQVFQRYNQLEKWSRERFPMMGPIDYQWSGQVLEPVDSLAFIGLNPHDKHTYIVTGDSGNGLTHGTVAGLLLTDLITGQSNQWETLYSPSRKPFHSKEEFLKENINVALQYGEWLTGGELNSIEDLAKDTGAVIREGVKKLAVYRDKQGDLHCYSAVCPHLGCLVNWNAAEKSWDCPCHGSRFDTDGQVITGPAISALKPCPMKKQS